MWVSVMHMRRLSNMVGWVQFHSLGIVLGMPTLGLFLFNILPLVELLFSIQFSGISGVSVFQNK